MDAEEREILNNVASKVGSIHTFIFGIDGQGGMNRALEQHKADDLQNFQMLTTTLQTTRTELATVRDQVRDIRTSWKVVLAIFTAAGASIHMAIDWLKSK